MKLQHLAMTIVLMGAVLGARAQVTYVEKVPSLEDLQAMLKKQAPGSQAATQDKAMRARQIEWTDPAAAPKEAAAQGNKAVAPAAGVDEARPSGNAGPGVAMPINFEVNSSRVSVSSMGYLDVLARLLASDPSLRLTIEGHTDATGSLQRNLPLSWDRALSVYRVLVDRYGIDARRLEPVGRGSLEPIEGLTPTAPMNRRVQFRVIG